MIVKAVVREMEKGKASVSLIWEGKADVYVCAQMCVRGKIKDTSEAFF